MSMVSKEMLDKLLSNLVFEPMGIDYKIFDNGLRGMYHSPYKIVIRFDPERYHTEGKEFSEEYATYLYEIEDHIDSALKYLGTDVGIFNSIEYGPTSKDIYGRVERKIKNVIPRVAKEFKEVSGLNLPLFDGLDMGYNYNRNLIRDYINFYFDKSNEIPDFENNSKYIILFHRILGKYVNLDSFATDVVTN